MWFAGLWFCIPQPIRRKSPMVSGSSVPISSYDPPHSHTTPTLPIISGDNHGGDEPIVVGGGVLICFDLKE